MAVELIEPSRSWARERERWLALRRRSRSARVLGSARAQEKSRVHSQPAMGFAQGPEKSRVH